MTGRAARLVLALAAALTFGFMLAPLAVIAASSLDGGSAAFIRFPPRSLSLHWYGQIPGKYWASLSVSLALGMCAASLSTVIGALAALGIMRGGARGKSWLTAWFNLPLQIPFVVTGVVFLQFYYALADATGLDLVGRFPGLVLAHVFFCIPYSVGAVASVITGSLERIENAARISGATEWRVFRRVTLPALRPGLVSGFFFALIVSFGDVPVSVFLTGAGPAPLPVEIFQTLQFDFDPTVLAISTIVVALSGAAILAVQRLTGLDVFLPRSKP